MASTATKTRSRKARNASLSHPPSQDSSFLSAFSPSADLFAIVSLAVDKHRLRIHDTHTGKSISEYIVDSARVTALSWATFRSPKAVLDGQETEDPAPRKKRKKHDSRAPQPDSEPDAIPVVLLGLSTGSAIMFSPSHARVIRIFSCPSITSAVLSVDVYSDVPSAVLIFLTLGADGFICTWNAQTGELISNTKTDDRLPGTSLSIRPGDDIRLLSARFIGHASNITMLRWQPFDYDSQSPRKFASVAESDRLVHIWEVPRVSGNEGKLVATAPLDSDAKHIAFSQSPSHPSLLVLSASGRITIFTTRNDQGATMTSKKTKEKVTTLSPRSSTTISFKRGMTVPVINAAFDQDGRIRVAWLAGGVRPVFDVVRYLDDSGDFIEAINIVHEDASAGLVDVDAHATAAPNKRYVEPSSLAVRSGTEIAQDASVDDLADLGGELDVDLAELSLGQRLTALDPLASRPADAEHSDSEDPERPARLPPQLAVPLLGACVQRLGRSSAPGTQRAAVLVRWIRAVLVVHSGHLMTVRRIIALVCDVNTDSSKRDHDWSCPTDARPRGSARRVARDANSAPYVARVAPLTVRQARYSITTGRSACNCSASTIGSQW
ncbi:hypothetical protein BJV77DRAFT_994592 [Russula vinacea]|nr:hypothetical protein BJV77DRAFT_994592 [Russula vinacea]